MTENIPPVPPAPQNYPPHAPSGAIPGYEPPSGPPQPDAPAPPAYGKQQYQQPQYAPYPPQQYAPVPPYGQPRAKSSGLRIAAGIVGIVMGTFLLVPAIAGFASSAAGMAFLILLAALGNITAGILVLANQRARTKWAPVTLLSTAGFALLLGLIGLAADFYGATLLLMTLVLAVPVFILLGLGLGKEKQSA